MNPKSRVKGISSSVQGLLSKDNDLKYLSQRALVCYLRSVFLQKNKDVFDVSEIDVKALSQSFGLPNAPKVKFLNSTGAKIKKKDETNDEKSTNKTKGVSNGKGHFSDDDVDNNDDDDSDISSEARMRTMILPTEKKMMHPRLHHLNQRKKTIYRGQTRTNA